MGAWETAKTIYGVVDKVTGVTDAVDWLAAPYRDAYDQYDVGKTREYDNNAQEAAADEAECDYKSNDRLLDRIPLLGTVKGVKEVAQDAYAYGDKLFGDGSAQSSDEEKAEEIANARWSAAAQASGYAGQTENGSGYSQVPDEGPNTSEEPTSSEECP
jgi:hypothetical protein